VKGNVCIPWRYAPAGSPLNWSSTRNYIRSSFFQPLLFDRLIHRSIYRLFFESKRKAGISKNGRSSGGSFRSEPPCSGACSSLRSPTPWAGSLPCGARSLPAPRLRPGATRSSWRFLAGAGGTRSSRFFPSHFKSHFLQLKNNKGTNRWHRQRVPKEGLTRTPSQTRKMQLQ